MTQILTPELMLLSHPCQTRSCPVLSLLRVWAETRRRGLRYRTKVQVLFSSLLQAEVTAQGRYRATGGMDCSNTGPTRGAASLFPCLPVSSGAVIFLTFNGLLTTHGLTYITNQICLVFSPKPDCLTLSCSFVQPHTWQISDRPCPLRSQTLSQF